MEIIYAKYFFRREIKNMNYFYDGDFDGLMTVVFDAYKYRTDLESVTSESKQVEIDFKEIHVKTDIGKARRVEQYISKNISEKFLFTVRIAFLSNNPDKDTVIVKSIYKIMKSGYSFINSVDEDIMMLNRLERQVLDERHRFLGLLRFREIGDNVLFAVFEPKNNLLPTLINHFQDRLKNEKFVIYDKKRSMLAYYNSKSTEIIFTENINICETENEEKFSDLWRIFHRSLSIKERKNKKLQMSHIPKYYWKYLVEEL